MRYILTTLLLFNLFLFAFVNADPIVIQGKITDESGVPIVGATVMVKGAHTGTITDNKGEFKLTVDTNDKTIVVRATGYESQELKIANIKVTLSVQLKTITSGLQEVVVTGYSSKRKSVKTGSETISGFKYPPAAQDQMLQGKVAGVIIQGTPGGSTTIRIRGIASNSVNDDDDYSLLHGYSTSNDTLNFVETEREGYDNIIENRFLRVTDNPLSTFSIDVDAASYSNVRRFLQQGQMPPPGAVRIEELINYFKYDYPQPQGKDPFSINTEIAQCPWNKDHQLMLIGLQGKKVPTESLPASNLVFLIDVSGSMMDEDKLPLVKASMKMLVDQLREQDRVAMVVYAGAAGLVLPSIQGTEKNQIKEALDKLEAGGSTAGGAGIQLAYQVAKQNFISGGNNRVILCTDGDFNVGASSDDAMERLIEEERKSGVFLTVLGFGKGNYQDAKMQKLADKGNGNHAYIDQLSEAKKVFVNEFGGTLFTIAKDVKLQLEFNPAKVQGYRLIGYENRLLAKEDFNNDKKDAGDLGSGHTVTALYEIIPTGVKTDLLDKVDNLKYQAQMQSITMNKELVTVKFRYKQPDGDTSKLLEKIVMAEEKDWKATSNNFRFTAAVVQFGMILRQSAFKGNSSYEFVREMAKAAQGKDEEGYRKDFLKLLQKANVAARKEIPVGEDDDEETEPTK